MTQFVLHFRILRELSNFEEMTGYEFVDNPSNDWYFGILQNLAPNVGVWQNLSYKLYLKLPQNWREREFKKDYYFIVNPSYQNGKLAYVTLFKTYGMYHEDGTLVKEIISFNENIPTYMARIPEKEDYIQHYYFDKNTGKGQAFPNVTYYDNKTYSLSELFYMINEEISLSNVDFIYGFLNLGMINDKLKKEEKELLLGFVNTLKGKTLDAIENLKLIKDSNLEYWGDQYHYSGAYSSRDILKMMIENYKNRNKTQLPTDFNKNYKEVVKAVW